MDYLVHTANVLYMFSYLVRDILWLRVLTVIAASLLIPYFYAQPNPLLAAISWNLVFTALNIYWICRLVLERRPVQLNADEQQLRQMAFKAMTPRDLLKLLGVAHWESHPIDYRFLEPGETSERLAVIYAGRVCVAVEGNPVAELREGHFIGGTSFFTDEPGGASVFALEPIRCVWWPKRKLKDFLRKNPELHASFQLVLGMDLTSRLQESWARR
jgi:hypothetical protein